MRLPEFSSTFECEYCVLSAVKPDGENLVSTIPQTRSFPQGQTPNKHRTNKNTDDKSLIIKSQTLVLDRQSALDCQG